MNNVSGMTLLINIRTDTEKERKREREREREREGEKGFRRTTSGAENILLHKREKGSR